MKIGKDELIKVLSQFNPWWRNESTDLPVWRRAVFQELFTWIYNPPAFRATLLSGARQIGKTTLLLQAIDRLLKEGVTPGNILYATFDHPIIKIAGVDAVIEAWREREPKMEGMEYLFLDEAQFMQDCGTWIKHQVDFVKDRRIIFTGSAMPLIHKEQESGVGRLHTIRLSTLSFYEYLQLKFQNSYNAKTYSDVVDFFKNVIGKNEDLPKSLSKKILTVVSKNGHHLPELPKIKSLRELLAWSPQEFLRVAEIAEPYVGHFHEYLLRGGFPQSAQIESITQVQRLLREDIIDKVLKRDMTALFGVRRVLDLEQTFLYLCMHDGGLLDVQELCENLEVKRPTALHFIELLEATHLIYRLAPFGYGKDILRAKYKIYLADAAIAPAVLLRGKNILENPAALGVATETAVFKHLFARYYSHDVRFSHWRGTKDHEVDLVAEIGEQIIPFEVKYRNQTSNRLKGLLKLCQTKPISYGYVITKSLDDFGLLENNNLSTKIMRIPAPLLCYWMGEAELSQIESFD